MGAAIFPWSSPPFKNWATLRAHELAKAGEPAELVIWFNKRAYTAAELERAGEPEYAVRRAGGQVERSPHAPNPPPPALRVVYRRSG